MMSSEEATDLLHHISHNVLTVISLIAVAAEVRLFYVISAKKSRIPSLFRIIILHILISHIGITFFQLVHFAVDRALEVDTKLKQRPSQGFIIGNETSDAGLVHKRSQRPLSHCDVLAIVVFTFWLVNCMLNTLHALIRFDSVCIPFHYKKYWTERRLAVYCSIIWAFALLMILIVPHKLRLYYNATKFLVLLFSIATVILYVITLMYWKLVKIEFRSSIPQPVLRTTIACFALSSADIFGNILALHMFFSTPTSRELQDDEYLISRGLWTEIIQVTRQLREILFPILLIALFRKVRQLFFGRETDSKSGQQNSTGSVQTRVVDSHSPLINRTSL